ncbi:mitogen-activated protein kinase-binding protein 1-like isoform X4 [Ptychodera flava]|uniref:mitogen-activated protein kinase-binding protein 1-like isoform X4 n=1 Tax=Ptychodera flava TaxID=63121 RepID=UPI00396A2613
MSLIRQPAPNGHERQLRKIVRSPLLKKRTSKSVPLGERVTLERVLGLTLSDNCAFDCDRNTGLIAYPAGCVVVLFNPRKNKQTHIFSHFRKTITALAFSPDGKYIVTGESGHMPAVRIWDVAEKTQVVEFAGHKFGITCVAFSPNNKYVVSVGSQHDMVVNVWDWKNSKRAASNKISSKVTAICFHESGNSFVTVGTRNVRFWYMSSTKSREAVPLHGRSGILGEQRNNFFCDVACGKGANKEKTFCITKSGLLCEFDDKRLLDKWVELRTSQAYCVAVSESYIFAGCANGVIRIFSADTLHYTGTLPRPHDLGVNVAASMDPSTYSHLVTAQYPNAVAITHDDENHRLTAVYDDHSLYVWDVRDIKKIGKSWSFLYHSAPVWGVEFYPNIPDGNKSLLPAGSFITCSTDNTIRVWNMESSSSNDNAIKRNIFSNELLNIVYLDGDFSNLCESEETKLSGPDKTDPTSSEDKKGVRCFCISPNGQQLAAGDRSGNVHIYDFHFYDEILKIEAHDAEVLCLEYSKPQTGYKLLASASRDRLIHIFNVQEDYALLQTLDDHSSSITAVRFTDQPNDLHMISCGADKSIMFRTAVRTPDGGLQFARNHHVNSKSTFYDMATDASMKYVVAACQDRNLRIYNIKSGKQKRCYKGSMSDDGTLIRVDLDPSGGYAATSCSDKTMSIYDFYAGECVATMMGHSELVTGLRFSNDCKNMISVSGDGCIFVWKLPIMFTQNMKDRMAEMGQVKEKRPYPMLRRGTYTAFPSVIPEKPSSEFDETTVDHGASPLEELLGQKFLPARESILQPAAIQRLKGTLGDPKRPIENVGIREPDYRFSVGPLPSWAKKQVLGEQGDSPDTYSSPTQPKGRWAQRVDDRGFQVKSEWEDNTSIQLRLAECMDRRRLTVEQDTLSEQVSQMQIHLLMLEEKTRYGPYASRKEGDATVLDDEEDDDDDDDEFLPAAKRLANLEEMTDENVQDGVRTSRGSERVGVPPRPRDLAIGRAAKGSDDNLESPSTPDREVAETMAGELLKLEGSEDDDMDDKEVIIYLPTEEEEENASSDSSKYCVTQNTNFMKKYAQKWRKLSLTAICSQDRKLSTDSTESLDPTTISGTDSTSRDNSEEDDEERPDTPFEEMPQIVDSSEDNKEKEDETEFLKHNFESLSVVPEQEKFDNNIEHMEITGSDYIQQLQGGRLSISTRFLTRAQQNQLRNLASMSNQPIATATAAYESELSKRQQETAKAVEETRKRLQEMGFYKGTRKRALSERSESTEKTDNEKTESTTESKPNSQFSTKDRTVITKPASVNIEPSNKDGKERNQVDISKDEKGNDESKSGGTAKEMLLQKSASSSSSDQSETELAGQAEVKGQGISGTGQESANVKEKRTSSKEASVAAQKASTTEVKGQETSSGEDAGTGKAVSIADTKVQVTSEESARTEQKVLSASVKGQTVSTESARTGQKILMSDAKEKEISSEGAGAEQKGSTDVKEQRPSSTQALTNGQMQSKTRTPRTLPTPNMPAAIATLETVTLETSEITSVPAPKPDETGTRKNSPKAGASPDSPPQHIANKENIRLRDKPRSPKPQFRFRSHSQSESGRFPIRKTSSTSALNVTSTRRGKNESENNSPTHSVTLRTRARSQEGLERIPTSRSRAARRARTERHLPALPTGKTPSNTNTETTSTTTTSTTTTTSRPRRSLYAPTESSLAKISSALHTESTNSPRTRRLKSQTSLELTSPENEDNSYPTKAFKEAEDKLTMPPPASTSVAKTKATSRRSLSDPRSRNYSKARRFPPNSPTKDASRSLTINDTTYHNSNVCGRVSKEGQFNCHFAAQH